MAIKFMKKNAIKFMRFDSMNGKIINFHLKSMKLLKMYFS
jgi:hypothetical protein